MMGWPQITLIVLLALGTGLHLAKHGQPKNDTYSFWWALFGDAVIVGLLIAGGFFK